MLRYSVLWLVLACACTTGERDAVVTRDSAGVAIAENVPSYATYAAVDPTPLLRLGRADGDGPDVFGRVRAAVLLEDGTVAVADALSREVRIFGSDGAHLRTFGRPGEGPGELQNLWAIAARRDSILALDNLAGRISVFDRTGDFGRSYPVPRVEDALAPNIAGWFEDGAAVFSATRRSPAEDRSTLVLYTVDVEGRIADRLGVLPDQRLGSNGMGLGFGARTQLAVGGGLVWYSIGELFEVRGLDRAGRLRRIVRLAREPEPVSDAAIDEARDRVRSDLVRQRISGPAVQRILDTEYAATFPVHGSLLVSATGELWVERYRSNLLEDERPAEWDVFDAGGILRGSVVLPPGLRLIAVGPDVLLCEHTDSLGVQRIQMHAVDRR